MAVKPTVLFVCVHNAGRSQMAAGYLQHLAGDRVDVLSAGSAPADQVNQVAVAAMAEEGIDISSEQPKVLTTDTVRESDVVITMGCGDVCPSSRASATKTGSSTTPPGKASSRSDPSATTSGPGSRALSPTFCRSVNELPASWLRCKGPPRRHSVPLACVLAAAASRAPQQGSPRGGPQRAITASFADLLAGGS